VGRALASMRAGQRPDHRHSRLLGPGRHPSLVCYRLALFHRELRTSLIPFASSFKHRKYLDPKVQLLEAATLLRVATR